MKQSIKLFLISLLIILTQPLNATVQGVSHGSISGIVIDSETNKPLFYTNIFLANTTLGTASDKNGQFRIDNVPIGNYQLIVSMIGYELKKLNISVRFRKTQNFKIYLPRKPVQGKTISVSAYKPKSWQKNFQVFRELLLGQSSFADKCRLINTNVLNIIYNKTTHTLSVKTMEPLHIENKALGYDIYLTIEEFSYQGVGFFKFKGISRFIEMKPVKLQQRKIWIRNRLKAYNGSLRHFLVSLANNRVKEQGFKTFLVDHIKQHPDFTKLNKLAHQINPDSISFKAESYFEKKLFFRKYLKVEYTKEPESKRYMPYSKKKAFQTSWILLNTDQPVIYTIYGSLYDPFKIKTYGYWAWERLAESLPYNYIPDPANLIQYLKPVSFPANKIKSFNKYRKFNKSDYAHPPVSLFKNSIDAVLSGNKKLGTSLFYQGLSYPGSSEIFDSLYIPSSYLIKNIHLDNNKIKKNENLLKMWIELDPTPASLVNEALCELVNRMSSFSKVIGRTFSYDGRKTIYLKFGKPDLLINFNKFGLIPENSCWVYKRDTTEIVFDFIKSGSTYVLLKNVNSLIPGFDENSVENLMDFIQSRLSISKLYHNFIVSIYKNINDSKIHQETEKNIYKYLAHKIFNNFSTFYRLVTTKQAGLPFSPFKSISEPLIVVSNLFTMPIGNKSLINLSMGIPCYQLGILPDDSEKVSYLQIFYTVFHENNDILYRKEFNGTIKYSNHLIPVNSIAISSVSDTLPYGKFKIAIQIEDTSTKRIWHNKIQLTTIPNNDKLFLSDIEPVFADSKKHFLIYPSTRISKLSGIRFMVWFQNLKKNLNGLYNYNLSWELSKNNVNFFSKQYKINGEKSFKTYSSNGNRIISIDISKIVPGFYNLCVTLQDINSNSIQKSMLQIQIVR
ncbi:carboxypeptidase-like regulatory domain-containing protein [bacterium]|nr:carboxypeptidase-like regulatory domain-containing protein [bacterium]